MRDDDESPLVRDIRALELLDRLQIAVVRRLVEQEEVDMAWLELRPRALPGRTIPTARTTWPRCPSNEGHKPKWLGGVLAFAQAPVNLA